MSQADKLDNLKKRTGKTTKNLDELEENTTNFQDNIDSNKSQPEEKETNGNINLADILELKNSINQLKDDADMWKERSARLSAEISNLQKQQEIDLGGAKKSGKKQVSSQIIIFLNTLNLAFSFAPSSDDMKVNSFIATLKTSFEKLIADLKNAGIEIIAPKEGEIFNPEIMSALDIAADSQDYPIVKRVAGLGYKIDGQVIQPSSVLLK
jgi:molecular chaperone GrpE (heat shock protein)